MQTSLAYWYYLTYVSTEYILRRTKIQFTVQFSFTISHGREHPRNLGTVRTEHMCELRIFNSKAVTIHPLPENKRDFLSHTLVYYPIVWKSFENRTEVRGGLQCDCLINRKQQENGGVYIKKGLHNTDSSTDIIGNTIREIIQAGRIAHMGRKSMHIKFWPLSRKRRHDLEVLDVDGRVTLKWIFTWAKGVEWNGQV